MTAEELEKLSPQPDDFETNDALGIARGLNDIAVQLAKIHGELELINMREEYKMDLCPDCGEIHESTPEPTN